MNYAIEWLKQERELMTIEAKYALNDDELNRINKIIADFTDALNKLTIPVVVGRSEQLCDHEYVWDNSQDSECMKRTCEKCGHKDA